MGKSAVTRKDALMSGDSIALRLVACWAFISLGFGGSEAHKALLLSVFAMSAANPAVDAEGGPSEAVATAGADSPVPSPVPDLETGDLSVADTAAAAADSVAAPEPSSGGKLYSCSGFTIRLW